MNRAVTLVDLLVLAEEERQAREQGHLQEEVIVSLPVIEALLDVFKEVVNRPHKGGPQTGIHVYAQGDACGLCAALKRLKEIQ